MKRIANWLRRLGSDDFTTSNEPLEPDVQNKVATDVALLNCLKLICLQRDMWNSLVDSIEDTTPLVISVDKDTKNVYLMLMAQIQASMVVIGETNNIPQELLDEIRKSQ